MSGPMLTTGQKVPQSERDRVVEAGLDGRYIDLRLTTGIIAMNSHSSAYSTDKKDLRSNASERKTANSTGAS